MRKYLALFISCMVISIVVSAQQSKAGKVSITILNEAGKPLEGATTELLRGKDSAVAKTSLTDKDGVAEFNRVTEGSYMVQVSMVNFSTHRSASFVVGSEHLNLAAINLNVKPGTNLKDVTVTAKKPFIQKLADRIVVNVENSIISAGSSALDVLERSPGVTVDQNDAISLRGRAGVIIMIDGKPSPMSGADLANYLRGLPSNAIERIEIITNPSAKYEAAGNSGIIDIRMKKDQRLGANGTLTAGYGQGVYPKANAGGTINYRNKKVNVFGNYNYGYREGLNHLIINRNFFRNGVFTGSDDKDNHSWSPVNFHTLRTGVDFFPSKNTIIGVVVNSSIVSVDRLANIRTTVNNSQRIADFKFISVGTNDDHNDNFVANINFKHKFDSIGRELTADLDYGKFNSASLTRTASSFFQLNGTPKREDDILDGDQTGDLSFKTGKVDYVNPMKKGAKFEVGYRSSLVSTDNNAKFFNVTPSQTFVDSTKTNRFFYKESNNAGYINFSKEAKKVSYQVGLRGEHTNIETRQVKGNRKFNNDYFLLFPSAFFNYKLKENKTIGLSVSRRIDRPNYSQLNPFLFQIDATIYATGAPLLRPQMTWSYEASYTVKNLNFTLGYSHTKEPLSSVLSPILDVIPTFEIKAGQDSNITVQIPVNLQSSDYVGLTSTLPIKINKWWNMINNINVYYNHFNGNLGGVLLSNGAPAANLRSNNTFTLKKGWTTELSGSVNTGGRSGYSVYRTQWALNAGAQKLVLKNQGTIRLNITDIFWTNLPKSTVKYEGRYVENWYAYRESRVANLSFTYRFGNNKVAAARRRAAASEEEIRRAGGQ